jgi:hypothetical protein
MVAVSLIPRHDYTDCDELVAEWRMFELQNSTMLLCFQVKQIDSQHSSYFSQAAVNGCFAGSVKQNSVKLSPIDV